MGRVVVSACLLGRPCRYDGGAKPCAVVRRMARRLDASGHPVVPVCPEVAGGLPTPRPPAEIVGATVRTRDGVDVTDAFRAGAALSLNQVRTTDGGPLAILKGKSPSCGVGLIYDGTYSGALVAGDGVFAGLLKGEGFYMATEADVRACAPSVEHPVAIVLGTGLGHLAGLVKPVRRIAYREIADFPEDARPVAGHTFEATVGTIDGVPVVMYPGRVHLYQGYGAREVTSLVRHAWRLGCRTMVFACATGSIPGNANKGLGVITDHINLTGCNPLVGWRGPETGYGAPELVEMTDVYTPYLRGLVHTVAGNLGISLGEGVLAGVLGPTFETPAEAAALRNMGASYVGMSTVCEAIMAHALGMHVLGLTLATNESGATGVSHQSVLEEATDHADEFERLVRGVLALL